MLNAPCSKVSAKITTLTIVASVGMLASACGGTDNGSSESMTTMPVASTSAPATTTSLTPSATPTSSAVEAPTVAQNSLGQVPARQAPIQQQPVPRSELTPIACQSGTGPIVTTWSDGSIGGWSQMCQDVKDQALAEERKANAPVCDGTVCTYPNGETMPDPNAPIQPVPTTSSQSSTSASQTAEQTTAPEAEPEGEQEPAQ